MNASFLIIDSIEETIIRKIEKHGASFGDSKFLICTGLIKSELMLDGKLSVFAIQAFNELNAIVLDEYYKGLFPDEYELLNENCIKFTKEDDRFFDADIGIVGFTSDRWEKHLSKWTSSILDVNMPKKES